MCTEACTAITVPCNSYRHLALSTNNIEKIAGLAGLPLLEVQFLQIFGFGDF